MAIAFALLGLGVSGFVFEFETTSIVLCMCAGAFVGYLIAGSMTAKGKILQENFIKIGNLVGLSLDEIKSKVGAPNQASSCTVADTGKQGSLYTWSANPYSITLLFDESLICLGVNQETSL